MPAPDHLGAMPMLRKAILYRSPYYSVLALLSTTFEQRFSNVLSVVTAGDVLDSNVLSVVTDGDVLYTQWTALRVRHTCNLSAHCVHPNIQTKILVHLHPCVVTAHQIDTHGSQRPFSNTPP